MSKLKMGVIGLGGRGTAILKDVILPMGEAEVIAVCDLYQDRCDAAVKIIQEASDNAVESFSDYKKLLSIKGLDAIYIATSWQTHIEIAIASMDAGVAVASDVSGAFSIEECWELVKTQQRTNVPCMLMENCCYGRDEMMIMNMQEQGVFGEIIHCGGGYHHDLREEISFGKENRHYRLDNYMHRNCENYPTHELGPIAQILGINRGNSMLTLTSTASKAAGLHQYIADKKSDDKQLADWNFAQGDIVTTVIKCAGGQTITLTLDTTLPRAYSRGFKVQGTKGMYMEDNRSLFIDGIHNKYDFEWKQQFNNVDEYREQYDHPTWKKFLEEGVKGGHDGMDWLVFQDFFGSIKNGDAMPIDIFDMASWLVISVLSEQSIALGGQPVSIPDFTNGKWMTR